MWRLVLVLFLAISKPIQSQVLEQNNDSTKASKLSFGLNLGCGWTYEDQAHLYTITAGHSIDFHIHNKYSFQFAPRYLWFWKWNEHYLTFPLHFRIRLTEKLDLFSGPSLTYEISHFRNLGFSGGLYYNLAPHSSIILSILTFNLYNYHIDYVLNPISFSFNYWF